MSVSYSSPIVPNMQPEISTTQNRKQSSIPYGVTGLTVGGIAGTAIGMKKNPFIAKNGEAKDTFAKKVFNEFIERADDLVRKAHQQKTEIYDALETINSADDLRALFSSKPDAKINLEADFLQNINSSNLNESKKTIKETIEAELKSSHQNLKNKIKNFWDAEKKKFVNPSGGDDKVFDSINAAKKGMKLKVVAKYAAIGAAITGIAAVILHKVFSKNTDV